MLLYKLTVYIFLIYVKFKNKLHSKLEKVNKNQIKSNKVKTSFTNDETVISSNKSINSESSKYIFIHFFVLKICKLILKA